MSVCVFVFARAKNKMVANLSTWTNGSAEVVGMSGTHPAHLTGSTGAPFAGDTTTHNGCLLVQGDFDPQDNPHNIVNKQVRFLLLLLFSRTFHIQFAWVGDGCCGEGEG